MIFTRRGINIKQYPAIERYLETFKTQLKPKPKEWNEKKDGKWKGRKPGSYQWFEIQDSIDYFEEFDKPKIILPDISPRGNFTFDCEGKYYSVNTTYIIPTDDKYLLGILNSSLITQFYKSISSTYRGGYLRFIYQYLIQLPIRTIDFNDKNDKAMHDRMVELVEVMLKLNKELCEQKLSERDREALKRRIDYTDREIDKLVYKLYGLTDDEIRIVEG